MVILFLKIKIINKNKLNIMNKTKFKKIDNKQYKNLIDLCRKENKKLRAYLGLLCIVVAIIGIYILFLLKENTYIIPFICVLLIVVELYNQFVLPNFTFLLRQTAKEEPDLNYNQIYQRIFY